MKVIEKKSGRVVEFHLYMLDLDNMVRSNDIADDFFAGTDGFVDDVDYCAEYVKDWVDSTGDFYGADDGLWRKAEINGELYTNYGL